MSRVTFVLDNDELQALARICALHTPTSPAENTIRARILGTAAEGCAETEAAAVSAEPPAPTNTTAQPSRILAGIEERAGQEVQA